MAKYKVLVGIDYPPNKRAEAGDIVDDLPSGSIKWLVAEGYIEAADSKTSKKPEPVFDPAAEDGDGDGMVQDGTEFERPADSEAK